MVKFIPSWLTASDLGTAIEANTIAIPLLATSTATIVLSAGVDSLDLGIDTSLVTNVTFNGVAKALGFSGNTITFPALTESNTVVVAANIPLVFDLIGGKLPKGMAMSRSGTISGVPNGIVDPDGEIYTFTVRVSNGTTVRDRTFSILVTPVAQTAVWNMAGLPLETFDVTYSSQPYHILGEIKRGDSFSYSIDVSHPDGDVVDVRVVDSAGIEAAPTNYNGSLPPGLTLSGTQIEGVVLPSAPPGRYFFTLSVLATSAPAPIPCMIEVLHLRTTAFKRPVRIQWVTSGGSLGTLGELDVSDLGIRARDPNGGAVSYNLLFGTGELPPGLLLNPQTGDIEGRVLFVPARQTFSFTVRAASGTIFADRTFSITISDDVAAENISEVSLKFQGPDKKKALAGYADAIPVDWLYRPSDKNFGMVTEPHIHVARGIYPDQTLSLLDYREDIECLFGPHDIAEVRNASGEVIYEVLYRKIIDPMDSDPFGRDDRTTGLVVDYAQSKEGQQIHPQSIWNMRYDLLVDYGTEEGDMLPDWMSRDELHRGFKTAFAIAYMLPGFGKNALSVVNESSSVTKNGFEVKFDRVLLSKTGVGRTILDDDGSRLLPIYVPAGVGQVTTGKWTSIVEEVFAIDVVNVSGANVTDMSSLEILDQSQFNFNVKAGTIAFTSVARNRMLYFISRGTPPLGPRCVNTPVGTRLLLGPFVDGVKMIEIDDEEVYLGHYTTDSAKGAMTREQAFVAGSQVVITLGETVFDQTEEGETTFDYMGEPFGKFIKLSTAIQKYPVEADPTPFRLEALTMANASVLEGAASGTLVGTIEGKLDSSTLTLIDNAGGRFVLSGTKIFTTGVVTDFETSAGSYVVKLRESYSYAANSPRVSSVEIKVYNDFE